MGVDGARTHCSVHLQSGGYEDDVDEGLVPVLRLAWLAGFETMSSCENAGESLADLPKDEPHMAAEVALLRDRAHIDFCQSGSIAGFLNVVTDGNPSGAMLARMSHWLTPGAWAKNLIVLQLGRGFATYGEQLYFPVSDIDEIARCLERALQAAPGSD